MVSVSYIDGIFCRVDQDNNGFVDANELQRALSNGLGTMFNMQTVRLMMTMFDRDMNGTIDRKEFIHLFRYVHEWQQCFRRHDRDNSGLIDFNELQSALVSFGYRLSPTFTNLMLHRFDRTRTGAIAFDDFIYACVCLQLLTNAFKKYDLQHNGWAMFSFEQFLASAFSVII